MEILGNIEWNWNLFKKRQPRIVNRSY